MRSGNQLDIFSMTKKKHQNTVLNWFWENWGNEYLQIQKKPKKYIFFKKVPSNCLGN